MLGGDAGRPALPALAEISEVGQDHIAQDGRQGQLSHEPVQDGLRGRLVESVQSPAELGEGLAARLAGLAGMGARAAVERGARCLGRGQPFGQVGLHAPDPRLVRGGVQPEPAGGAHRLQQAVAALPGPEHVIADAQAAAELADAQQRAV